MIDLLDVVQMDKIFVEFCLIEFFIPYSTWK